MYNSLTLIRRCINTLPDQKAQSEEDFGLLAEAIYELTSIYYESLLVK
jgi:hypothetical protein